MATFLLVAGPPTSSALWKDVVQRIKMLGHEARAIELFTAEPSNGVAWHTALSTAIEECSGPVFLVAHGAATAVARHVVNSTPPTGLILTNGPLNRLPKAYRLGRASLRAPGPLIPSALLLRLLASPIGLRRTVVNPYVWDHDTVVRVCGPLIRDHDTIDRVRRFMNELPKHINTAPTPTVPTRLIWGDSDTLIPPSNAVIFASEHSNTSIDIISGGHHFHPLERPWEIADLAVSWSQVQSTTT